MHTAEGSGGGAGDERRDHHDSGPQAIGVGGGDDSIARIQLAARWAEAYAPASGDSLAGILKRFRATYEYLDAVTHGVEPGDVDSLGDAVPRAWPQAAAPPPRRELSEPAAETRPFGV